MSADFIVSAPGKVILFGEHAVVHGKPAIAASVSLRTYLLVKKSLHPGQITLDFPDVKLLKTWDICDLPWAQCAQRIDNSTVMDPATALDADVVSIIQETCLTDITDTFQRAAALAFLYLYMCLCIPETPSMMYIAKSTLPVGAGLGSSASFSVCLAAALLKLGKVIPDPTATTSLNKRMSAVSISSNEVEVDPLDVINKWSFLGECCIHGNPSGIDNAVATRGGAVMFKRPSTMDPIPTFPPLRLVLTNTRNPRSTAELVAGVGRLKDSWPSVVVPILDSIDNISQEAYSLLQSFDSSVSAGVDSDSSPGHALALKLAPLVHINHALLVGLGVSHPTLEKVKMVSDTLKIGETKLTGAGGGGCAITLVTLPDGDHCEQQIKTLSDLLAASGFEVFETVIGGPGVGITASKVELEQQMAGIIHNDDFLKLGDWHYWTY